MRRAAFLIPGVAALAALALPPALTLGATDGGIRGSVAALPITGTKLPLAFSSLKKSRPAVPAASPAAAPFERPAA